MFVKVEMNKHVYTLQRESDVKMNSVGTVIVKRPVYIAAKHDGTLFNSAENKNILQ